MTNHDLTRERLMALVQYDPETGSFFRIGRSKYNSITNRAAGTKATHSRGYVTFSVDNAKHYAHRLAWLYMTGAWPKLNIDHINGNKADNRWENLRAVDGSANQQNRHRPWKRSKSGFMGVEDCGTYFVAHIRAGGKKRHLGCFRSAEEAHASYMTAKRALHPGYVPLSSD